MDLYYSNHVMGDLKLALSVLATVINKPESTRAIIDTGWKSVDCSFGMPRIKGMPGAKITALHSEHGLMALDPVASEQIGVGDKLELSVFLADPTVNLYESMYCVRGDEWSTPGLSMVVEGFNECFES